jgi:hypothetical protein
VFLNSNMAPKRPPLIDFSLSLTGETARRCSIFIEQMIEWEISNELRKRKRKPVDQKALEVSANMLCGNLVQFWNRDPKGTFGVLRGSEWYAENRHQLRPEITPKGVTGFLDFLVRKNLVELVSEGKKHPDAKQGIPTQIRAKKGFISFLNQGDISPFDFQYHRIPIVLKSEDKTVIPYEQTDLTEAMASLVNIINRVLLNHWADIELPHSKLMALRDKGVYLEKTLYSRRTVYRVFNNGTFDDGGRFYGPWWHSIPGELRSLITINGEDTVELDYSSMHPRMLYAYLRIECPDDPYDVGLDPKHRDIVKKAFNALINAQGRISKFSNPEKGPVFDADEMGMTWSEFLNHIKSYHPKLKDHFSSGIGLKFQRIDSDIAETTMLHFAKENVPILSIHDSFIMRNGYEETLSKVMADAFKARTGSDIPIKVTRKPIKARHDRIAYQAGQGAYKNYNPTDSLHELNTDYDTRFSDDPEYGPYKKRLSEFFEYRSKSQSQVRRDLNAEQDPQKFAKLELDRLKGEDPC